MQEITVQLNHYKNAVYQGMYSDSRREGAGILFLDSGEIIVGNHKNDQLNGQCIVFLDWSCYFIGNFVRGMLDGQFVIRNKSMTIYSNINMNKIDGEILVISYQKLMARQWLIQNGEGTCLKQLQILPLWKQNEIISKIAPYIQPFPSPHQFLANSFNKNISIHNSKLTHTLQISLNIQNNSKLKISIFKDQLTQYGIYDNDSLNDIGFIWDGTHVLQGGFKQGKLNGQGLKYDILSDKIIYGSFKNGDIRTIDIVSDNYEVAKSELKKMKKDIHMHSLQFINTYVNERPIILLQNLLKTLELNQKAYDQELETRQALNNTYQKSTKIGILPRKYVISEQDHKDSNESSRSYDRYSNASVVKISGNWSQSHWKSNQSQNGRQKNALTQRDKLIDDIEQYKNIRNVLKVHKK